MKQGDTIPVTIAGQVVAQATVKELGDGTATLVVPGTLVVMAVRTEIAPEVTTLETPTTEHIITGVDRASGDADATVVTNDGGTPKVELPPVETPAPAVEENTHPTVSDDAAQQG